MSVTIAYRYAYDDESPPHPERFLRRRRPDHREHGPLPVRPRLLLGVYATS